LDKKLLSAVLMISMLLTTQAASAFSLDDLVCAGVKLSPGYWGAVAAIESAKLSGILKSQKDCEDAGDILGDFGIPTGTAKICVCKQVSWPSPSPVKPTCLEAHSVCAEGSPLMSDMQMSCTNNIDENVAIEVCAVDSFCCTQSWDQMCVSEVQSVFWSNVDAAESPPQPDAFGVFAPFVAAQKVVIEAFARVASTQVLCIGPRPPTGPRRAPVPAPQQSP
jgi:hypothetical protein